MGNRLKANAFSFDKFVDFSRAREVTANYKAAWFCFCGRDNAEE